MRRLSPEEASLWRKVAGGVRPIRPDALQTLNVRSSRAKSRDEYARAGVSTSLDTSGFGKDSIKLARDRATNTLDGSWDKRLSTGRIEPDFTIDLHGETLASAHAKLNHRLGAAIRSGARVVLLITGRPARDNPRLPPTSRGVIRASVQDWLAASSHSAQIAAIRAAHPRHGGTGALYLILRRAR